VAPSLPNLNPLDYQVWGQCCSLIHKLQLKPKTIPRFKDTVQLICTGKKATDNAVKDHSKQLQACVSANGGHIEHIM